MNSLVVSGILLASTLCGLFVGVYLRSVLPNPHLDGDSKDVVKMGTGLVAAVTGLVLGLLTASAKSTYDGQRATLHQVAANVVVLDRLLAFFGPDGSDARGLLRKSVTSFIDHLWPADRSRPAGAVAQKGGQAPRDQVNSSIPASRSGPVPLFGAQPPAEMDDPEFAAHGVALFEAIRNLPADTEARQTTKSQALQVSLELARGRWQLERWDNSSLPVPFLIVLNFWLAVLFLSFGLFTPRNATVLTVLFVCALSVAGALFLIVELDRPFTGLIRISNLPLRNAVGQLGR